MAISAPPEPTAVATTRSLAGLTDCELVAEVRRGRDRAFELLYERYHRRIAAHIYGMVGDHGRAEEIAQDVFMSALRRMRGTDRPIAFKPWIYEIAKNACIDQFRRARRTHEVSYDADEGLAARDHGRLVAVEPAPDVAVDQKIAIDHLRGAFGGLSQTHHEILVMRELEGLSYREIGERLGLSRPSVESTLFRARRRLGEEYEELVSGERCVRIQGIIATVGAGAPGARDQRRLAVHLSHCQPCRRHARVAGLDGAALVAPRGVGKKIAAFIPLPAFLRKRWPADEVVPAAANHHVSTLAQLSAQLSASVDPAIASWAKAAAAAATLAVAGVAGGAAVSDETRSALGAPAAKAPAKSVATPVESPASKLAGAPRLAPGRADAVAGRPSITKAAGAPARGAPAVGAPAAGSPPGPAKPSADAAPALSAPVTPAAPTKPPVVGSFDPGDYPTGGGRPGAGAGQPPAAGSVGNAAAGTAAAAASGGTATKAQLEGAADVAAKSAAAAAAEAASGSFVGG